MQTPSDYQTVAMNWLLAHTRGILADEPGVGKTLPSILAAKKYEGYKLIVAPAYLASNWENELRNNEEYDVCIVNGGVRSKK